MKTDNADNPDSAFTAPRLMLLLGALIFIAYPDIVLGTHAFNFRDAGLFSYPLAYYTKQSLLHGAVPLWNPYSSCGIPYLAQWNTMVLYPFSLFYVLLPMPWSLNYFILAHVLLAGLGMYYLALRWFGNRLAATLAGLVFAWNGSNMDILMWPAPTVAVGWMPWVVLLCEKAVEQGGRAIFWAALAGACQLLSGSPESVLCTWFIIIPLCFVHGFGNRQNASRIGLRMAAVIGLVAALSAIQLFPWLDFTLHGDRSSSYGGSRWALPIWGVANFFVPLFREMPSISGVYWQPGQEFYSSYYVGIITVTLAITAFVKGRNRRTIFLAVMAIAGLLSSYGDAAYFLPAFRTIMPLVGFLRYPVKYLLITLFCLPLLAASGTAWLQSHSDRRDILRVGAAVALAVICIVVGARLFPFAGEEWNATLQSGWTRLAFLLTALAILSRGARGVLAGFGLLLLIGADITTHAPRQNPTVPIEAYDHSVPPMSSIPQLGQSRAMLTPEVDGVMDHLANPSPLSLYLGRRSDLFRDCNLLDLIPKVDGFFPIYLRAEDQVARLFDHHEQPEPLKEFLGVSQVTSFEKLFTWNAQTNFMPMATIGQGPIFLNDSSTLQGLASPDFRPREIVYLPREVSGSIAAQADPAAKVLSSQVTASKCQFETESSRTALLVIAQSYYHCWKADIDGHAARLLRANFAFQAIEVPAGRHVVRLVYRDIFFYAGAGVSLVSLIFFAWGIRFSESRPSM